MFAISGIVFAQSQSLNAGDTIPAMEVYSCEGIAVPLYPPEGEISLILFQDTESWQTTHIMNEVLALYNRFHDSGLNVLGICTDTFEDDVYDFSHVWQLPWPQVMNKDWKVLQKIGADPPTSNLLINFNGKILACNLQMNNAPSVIEAMLDGSQGIPDLEQREYLSGTKRDWGPEQAAGKPDTPEVGDYASAWGSRTPDGQDEWIQLVYKEAIVPTSIRVYESYNPGAIYKVSVFNSSGVEKVVWQDEACSISEKMRISEIPCNVDFKTNRVKVYLKSAAIPGWNQIDAVGMTNAEGKVCWAVDAEASSTYAHELKVNVGFKNYVFPTGRQTEGIESLKEIDKAVDQMKSIATTDSRGNDTPFRLHIKTYVEGTNVLVIHKNTARWYRHHSSLLPVQTNDQAVHPAMINGVEWKPVWTALSSDSEAEEKHWTDVCDSIQPALPLKDCMIEIKLPQASLINCLCEQKENTATSPLMIGQAPRGSIYLVERPTAENSYILALAFEPFKVDGADWFECIVDIRPEKTDKNIALAEDHR